MEKESGLQLGWYFNEWISTTRTLDYAVKGVAPKGDSTVITLVNKGLMLMPVDVAVQDTADKASYLNIPLSLMLGARTEPLGGQSWTTLPPWQWTDPEYSFTIPVPMALLRQVDIDPFFRFGDVDRSNDSRDLGLGEQDRMDH
jgi:hypothetical protein